MSRSSGCRFSVVYMGMEVEGLMGNGEEIGMKGSRKPRWEEQRVWCGESQSAMLKMVGHVEIVFNNVVMWVGSQPKVSEEGILTVE